MVYTRNEILKYPGLVSDYLNIEDKSWYKKKGVDWKRLKNNDFFLNYEDQLKTVDEKWKPLFLEA